MDDPLPPKGNTRKLSGKRTVAPETRNTCLAGPESTPRSVDEPIAKQAFHGGFCISGER
jgi:hypothetical protein